VSSLDKQLIKKPLAGIHHIILKQCLRFKDKHFIMRYSTPPCTTSTKKHVMSHYTRTAVLLLDHCQKSLKPLLEETSLRSHSLTKLQSVLLVIDNLLLSHVSRFTEALHASREDVSVEKPVTAVQALRLGTTLDQDIEKTYSIQELQNPQDPLHHSCDHRHSLYENSFTKTAVDTLLFRLIVSLDLLIVRIDDIRYVMLGRQMDKEASTAVAKQNVGILPTSVLLLGLCTGLGCGAYFNRKLRTSLRDSGHWIMLITKVACVASLSLQLVNGMARSWMRGKIARSTNDLMEWTSQWKLIHNRTCFSSVSTFRSNSCGNSLSNRKELSCVDDESRTLIEHAMRHGTKTYFWRSTGEIRFMMLKRFMDVYYASVGTAITTNHTSTLTLPLVTGAAAFFYTLTGVTQEALSSFVNDSSLDLIKHAW
jgi:hypothetical protein